MSNNKNYFIPAIIFGVVFITTLTIKLIFAWNPPTSGAPNPAGQTLYADSNSNIGVGVLSPGAKLEVFSASSDSIIKLSRGPGSTTSTIFKIGTDSAFVIQNQSTNAFTIKNGNIGINTTNPNEKLTIDGSISVQELSEAPSTSAGYGKIYAKAGIGGNDSYTKLLLHSDNPSQTFSYTGSLQTYTVPFKVYSINVDARGARGGGGVSGFGARVQTTLSVTPGETLYIYIGDTGNYGVSDSNTSYNGGGTGGNPSDPNTKGADGGGASDIRQGGTSLTQRVVVAGGGGGGANYSGGAGGQNGSNGAIGGCSSVAGGGTQSGGGSGGTGDGNGSAGSLGSGGSGGNSSGGYRAGAGGGGGYYGGGGGCGWNIGGGGGGGGGSSYSSGTNTTYTSGYQNGDGQIIINPNFIDSSTNSHTITTNGDATQSSAQSKFSGSSAYFDGTGDYLSVPDSDDWNFGSGDFTIDFWVRFNSLPSNDYAILATQRQDASNKMILYWDNRDTNLNGMSFHFTNGGVLYGFTEPSLASQYSANTWYHIAIVRNGNNWYIFRNGIQTATASLSQTYPDYSGVVTIGGETNEAKYFNGYLDELRISKGVARWTSNFTPPVGPYDAGGLFFKSSSGEEIQL